MNDIRMVRYWTIRVQELKSMRPMAPEEAAELASAEDLQIAELRSMLAKRRCPCPECRGRAIHEWKTAIAFDLEARILRHELLRDSYRRIAAAPLGRPLAESIEDAEAKLAYYGGK